MTDKKPAGKTRVEAVKPQATQYENDYSFQENKALTASNVRTTAELMALLESDAGKNVEVEARVLAHKAGEGFGSRKLNKRGFIESFKKNNGSRSSSFREAYGDFDRGGIGSGYGNTVGQDFTPLLGGPFYKQLYYYNDWLKMHQDCFFAYHHDPFGKAAVNILVDFTLGRGFRLEFENQVMQAIWDAFDKANNFQDMFRNFALELSAYGENMFWKLPDNDRYISFSGAPQKVEDVPKAFIPRIRLIDPSNIVEIVTYPEDITRRLFYVWMTPTQYQIYTGKDDKTGKLVQGTKFIYQHIPAEQMLHYTVNAVSNEKRGRSDLFAALPYFKRLRDSVNYEIIAQQKNSAWAIDTTIEGDDQDIAAYKAAQQALGTIPNAGSEFIHTAAIKREYLANAGGGKNVSNAFEWCLSMISASTGIPANYWGTHLSGGSTRASALVATEPVAKRFEMRQQIYKKVISDIAEWLMKYYGIHSQFEIHFPEIITQDRSAKLKDLYMGETAGWWSNEKAAETAAGEMGFQDYDYQTEQEAIKQERPVETVSFPTMAGNAPLSSPSAVTGEERKAIADNEGA